MIEIILYGAIIGIWGFLFCIPLREHGMIFAWVEPTLWWLPEWLQYPAFLCPKCHAGQVALWSFPALFGWNYKMYFPFIVVAIFVAYVLERWYK